MTKFKKGEFFLIEHLVSKEPINQFKAWLDEAHGRKDIVLPNTFCLATVSKEGFPTARFIMLAYYSKIGFKFFTDYTSRKAKDIAENPNAAATFYWEDLNKSIRIEGKVEKMLEEESNAFFKTKNIKSQVATKASNQSSPIQSRDVILQNMGQIQKEYMKIKKDIPKPTNWGGYVLLPTSVEFLQMQKNHLSDRIRFRRPKEKEVPDGKILHQGEEGWVYERLSP